MVNKKHTLLLRLLGIPIFVIILLSIDLDKGLGLLRRVDLRMFFLAVSLLIPLYSLRVFRWNYLLKNQNIDYPIRSTFLVVLSSNFIGFITPGRLGELAKVVYLKSDLNTTYSRVLPTVLLDRLFDVYALLVFGVLGLWKYSLFDRIGVVSILFLLLVLVLPLLMFSEKLTSGVLSGLFRISFLKKHRERTMAALGSFYEGIRQLLSLRLTVAAVLTVAAYLVLFYCCYLLAASTAIHLDFFTVMFFVSVANILSYVPVTISGIGTRDAVFILLFSQIGKSMEEAVVFSALILVCFFILGGLAGFVCYTIKPLQIRKIRDNV